MHYSVLVTGEDIEEQMAPFNANNDDSRFTEFEIEVDGEYMESEAKSIIKGTEDDIKLSNVKKIKVNKKLLSAKGYNGLKKVEECLQEIKQLNKSIRNSEQEMRRYGKLMKEKKYKEIVKDANSYDEDEDGNLGYQNNPDGEWDWWEEGGRWNEFFKLKEEAKENYVLAPVNSNPYLSNPRLFDVNSALKKDIDFESIKIMNRRRALDNWKNGRELLKSGKKTEAYSKYWLSPKDKKKDFINREEYCLRTGVILHEGEWVSFDDSSSEKWQEEFDKFIKGLPDDTKLTVLDVHI